MRRGAELAGDIAGEVGGVGLCLEAHQVVIGQGAHNLLVMRHCRGDFRRRHGNVQEKADAVGQAAGAQDPRQRHQVIIMHPDQVTGFQMFGQKIGKAVVDPEIARQIAAGEFRQVLPVMQHRPQHPVGEAIVIFFEVLAYEVGDHIVRAVNTVMADLDIRGILHRLAAPAHPHTLIFLEQGAQRDFQAARMRSRLVGRDRHPIGNDEYARHATLENAMCSGSEGSPR